MPGFVYDVERDNDLPSDPPSDLPPTDPPPAPPRRFRSGPSGPDLAAGAAAGLFSVPEGMAYAAIGGFSPAAGLFAGIAPAILGSALTPSVLMITTLTSAIAVTSGTTVAHAHLNPADPAVVSALALTVGLAMALFAMAGAGSLLRRIPQSAMAGFSAGIAVQILAGGLSEATGYKGDSSHGQAWRLGYWAWHASLWSTRSTVVAVIAVCVWGLIAVARRIRPVALLAALLVVSIGVAILHVKVPLASSLGSIPHGIPLPSAPDWGAIPKLIPGACAVALVALAQAGGISTPKQDPDGTKARSNRNILAQAAANIVAAFCHAMPVGGSLSRTGVVVTAGARTRWAGLCAGGVLALLVCTAGPDLGRIPVPLIGGLIAVVGCELLAVRVRLARRLAVKSAYDALLFLAMLILTMQESPLVAIVACVVLAFVPKAMKVKFDETLAAAWGLVTGGQRVVIAAEED